MKDQQLSYFYNTHDITLQEYGAVHYWIRRNFKKPSFCQGVDCKGISKRLEWALKRGKEYEKKRGSFLCLCKSCHSKYDITENTRRKIGEARRGVKYRREQLLTRLIPIIQHDLLGKELKVFPSIDEAVLETGIGKSSIVHNARGRYKKAGNYIWKYESKFRRTT